MKRIVLLTALLLIATTVLSQETKEAYSDFAITSGNYEQEFVPDEIFMSVVIRERDSKGKISIEEQQQQMIDALAKQGFDIQKTLKMKELSSSYTKKGNMAFGRYELKFATAEDFFNAYAICESLDLSEVKLDRIDRSDREQLQYDAAAGAMKSARRKAEAIAATEGRKVGKCFRFADETTLKTITNQLSGAIYGLESRKYFSGSISVSNTTVKILPEIGTVKITSLVQAKFELE